MPGRLKSGAASACNDMWPACIECRVAVCLRVAKGMQMRPDDPSI